MGEPERYDTLTQIFGGCYDTSCMEAEESLEEISTFWVDAFESGSCSAEQAPRAREGQNPVGFPIVGFAPSHRRGGSSPDRNANCGANQEKSHEHCGGDAPSQPSSGGFAPRSKALWSDTCESPSQQSSWFGATCESDSDTIRGSSRDMVPPLGALDQEELRKRLGQVRRFRQERGEEPLSPPIVQRAKFLKITLWTSLQKRRREFVVNFTSRPLGMQFNVGMMPCVVKSIVLGSVAGNLGVKKGMVIKALDGENVTEMVYDEFYAKLSKKCIALPYLPPEV